jgi:hypothetical protein
MIDKYLVDLVKEFIENAKENGYDQVNWTNEDLAHDIVECTDITDDNYTSKDVLDTVAILRLQGLI